MIRVHRLLAMSGSLLRDTEGIQGTGKAVSEISFVGVVAHELSLDLHSFLESADCLFMVAGLAAEQTKELVRFGQARPVVGQVRANRR